LCKFATGSFLISYTSGAWVKPANYSGCQKKRSDCGTLFCYNTYAAILFSEDYYDNWYNGVLWEIQREQSRPAIDSRNL
jgi:hypothetical protein